MMPYDLISDVKVWAGVSRLPFSAQRSAAYPNVIVELKKRIWCIALVPLPIPLLKKSFLLSISESRQSEFVSELKRYLPRSGA
jgi:hypothetical protein